MQLYFRGLETGLIDQLCNEHRRFTTQLHRLQCSLRREPRPMKLAFLLYKYFPYGGLQRDLLRMVRECEARGHEIQIYLLVKKDIPEDLNVTVVPVKALFNHTKYRLYSEAVRELLKKDPVDCVVGFNKMPDLDIYYAADSCYAEKAATQRSWLYRLLPRFHHFSRFEAAVFGRESNTKIMMISDAQKPYFKKHYNTPEARMQPLPPGISRDRVAPDNSNAIRTSARQKLGIAGDDFLILFVGSGFIKKGLDRAILAVNSLPADVLGKVQFRIVGDDRIGRFQSLIEQYELEDSVKFLGGRRDIPELLLAGDLLLHPALDENAGLVLLEAMVAGMEVLATDVCGYAHYITEAGMGELVPSPFDQSVLNQKLLSMISSRDREASMTKGRQFAAEADIYSMPQVAVDCIEDYVGQRDADRVVIPATAVVIAKDEANKIQACIRSLKFFKEVLVIDSGSQDNTVELAKAEGATVIYNPWPGYSQQRQFGLERASYDWVLSVDADERVSPALRESIISLFEGDMTTTGFAINRRNHFMGHPLNYGEGYPDWIIRLFNRQHASWSQDLVHEKVTLEGDVERLGGDLDHFSEESLAEYLAKQNQYTTLQAEQMYQSGKRSSGFRMLTSPLFRFIKFYLFRGGFRDGVPGLVHIAFGCFNSFSKYAKLKEIELALNHQSGLKKDKGAGQGTGNPATSLIKQEMEKPATVSKPKVPQAVDS